MRNSRLMRADAMEEKAISLVRKYIAEHFDAEPTLFVTWQARVLQNFKCLIATTVPCGMYFELTYDGVKDRWYFDVYRKVANREVEND